LFKTLFVAAAASHRPTDIMRFNMKLAIVGSRDITEIDVGAYLPSGVTETVPGGAKGVDTLARGYAMKHSKRVTLIRV